MKKTLLLLIFLSFFSFSQTTAKVIGIKDGDTVLVLLGNNIQKILRLSEVDCPETGQAFGKNAKQFTSSQIFGKNIEFIETDIDRYGRTIAKIYYDNKYLSAEIIKAGLGWWYYHYSNNKNLKMIEDEASKNKIGLWSDPNSIPPWEWRKIKN